MHYVMEFDDEALRPLDYAALEAYEYRPYPADFVEDLIDYVTGMGYEFAEVCYMWEVAA